MWYDDILGTIGDTPLVRINRLARGLPCTVLAKLEFFNPGASVKDRIGVAMIEAAVRDGKLKPGGTIIEGTSGNTGAGLALAAIAHGYRCVFTTTDKQSKEKIDVLRALGAEVVVCPTNVAPDDPRSYYQVARRLEREIPNSYYVNQYDNPANAPAHYATTGPELWAQTDGRITHWIAGAGTGGTISGTAKFLKEQNPAIRVIGVDPYGSVYAKYWKTREFDENEIYPYITEGVGEDILAGNMEFDLVDDYVQVTDKDAMVTTRRLAREEGMFVGGSCGMAMAGALQWLESHRDDLKPSDVVVVLLPDGGFRCLSKIYNDEWMRQHGFMPKEPPVTADSVLASCEHAREVIEIAADTMVADAAARMAEHGISQAPVVEDPDARNRLVRDVMGKPFPVVDGETPVRDIAGLLHENRAAVLVRHQGDAGYEILTRTDLITALARS
jgi:cystathionine beta-synthase